MQDLEVQNFALHKRTEVCMMHRKGIVFFVFGSLFIGGGCLLTYLEKQNELTQLKLHVPKLAHEVKMIGEENMQLQYRLQEFERPDNLLKIAGEARFCHLKYPLGKDVLVLQEQSSLTQEEDFLAAGAQ